MDLVLLLFIKVVSLLLFCDIKILLRGFVSETITRRRSSYERRAKKNTFNYLSGMKNERFVHENR